MDGRQDLCDPSTASTPRSERQRNGRALVHESGVGYQADSWSSIVNTSISRAAQARCPSQP